MDKLNYSMAIDLVIKLMSDVEKLNKPGSDKKKWVIEQLHDLMPEFYAEYHLLIDAFIDGLVIVATSPEMIQTGKKCGKLCSKLLGCYV